MKSHYRGHKMAVWLNLIPQLHRPGDDDISMRHHHFRERGDHYYAGNIACFLPRKKKKQIKISHLIFFIYARVIFNTKFTVYLYRTSPGWMVYTTTAHRSNENKRFVNDILQHHRRWESHRQYYSYLGWLRGWCRTIAKISFSSLLQYNHCSSDYSGCRLYSLGVEYADLCRDLLPKRPR